MTTRLIGTTASALQQAAQALCDGDLVAFPTETVYGLGADADQFAAVRAVFATKGRPANHPLIVHVASAQALPHWADEVPDEAWQLAQHFWPGPLTMVLRRGARAHDALTGAQDTVGLRVPSHPVALALLSAFAQARGDQAAALAAPSANRFGRISPTTAAHVLAEFDGDAPRFVIDGGACSVGIESTIVDLSARNGHVVMARVLRPGAISAAALADALGRPVSVHRADPFDGDALPRVSGNLAQHYAPVKPLECVAAPLLAGRINALRDQKLAILAPAAALLDPPQQVIWRGVSPSDPQRYAHRLYAALRQMDNSGADRLIIVWPPEGEAWLAIHDRLRRASAGADPAMLAQPR